MFDRIRPIPVVQLSHPHTSHDFEVLQQLANTMPQIVWIARADGYREYYNKLWWDYTGLTEEQTCGEGWLQALHPEDVEPTLERWQKSLKSGEPYEAECRIRRASDGAYRWFLGRALPQRDAKGKVIRWFGTNTEIQVQKLTEQQLRDARDQMAAANEQKDQFLALLSHELRTPLNSILGWTRLMQEGLLEENELPEAIDAITRNAKAQAQLIEDILDISRIVNQKLRLERRVVPLAEVVKGAYDAIRPLAEAAGIRLAWTIEAPDLLVNADPGRLQQVINNLLTNSVKFTPPKGRIEIRISRANSFASIEVIDTGKGIVESFLPLIFDRFRQADSSYTRSHGGLGLGLTIARHLVEMHEGSIRAESAGEGKGAHFSVMLPVVAVDMRPEEMQKSPLAERPDMKILEGLRVLTVDDDESARDMISITLRKFGATVLAAPTVAQALELLDQELPHLLISDIAMPGVDGYEFIRSVRHLPNEEARRIPAIALTAFASVQDRSRAMELGFHMHLAKPIEPTQLIRAVAALVPLARPPLSCPDASH